ncbi:hypothetical protein JCM14469_14100 [Desulfatiferula olefinivorans]
MESFKTSVEENRRAFMAYTITRIRELLRNLPPARADLFQALPFLLHVNRPEFPCYVASDHRFYGIYRFDRSGFFKFGLRRFKTDPATLDNPADDEAPILGLYLMGSAGTLTQSRHSDFDFWVIVEENRLNENRLALLRQKLHLIETWCRELHQQDVTFFIMDVNKLRHNEFSVVDGESSGSAQPTILKDEFYRTFIMIAGKIPLWAVMPKDFDGSLSPESALALAGPDYIDTGDLTEIDSRECLGAVLWQVYKARKDPVKALIKASLAAYYAFNAAPSALLSSRVKAAFGQTRLDDYLCDPYLTVFDTIMAFYREMDDPKGLALIRQCIMLRLLGYPDIERTDPGGPKGRLLARFADAWDRGRKDLNRLSAMASWSEADKIAFEDNLFDKLSFLYELILRSLDDEDAVIAMRPEDLSILKNRTAAFIQKKPGKIPRCSTILRTRARNLSLWIGPDREQKTAWAVYGQGDPTPLFTGPDYLKVLGFIFANALNEARFITHPRHFLTIRAFLDHLYPRPDGVFTAPPRIEKIVLLFKDDARGNLIAADHLTFNSWGEFYFDTIELSALESLEAKCYKTAEFIFTAHVKHPDSKLQYLICQPGEGAYPSLGDIVQSGLDRLKRQDPIRERVEPEETRRPGKPKPFLDLL